MAKRIHMVVLLACLTTLAWPGGFSFANEVNTTGIVDVGNRYCPVSGDKVSGKHFVEYQGKRYGLCCSMCRNKFEANPEKYISQLETGEINEPDTDMAMAHDESGEHHLDHGEM
ncbi:MAG: hypothetical protein COV74_07200 [Candidatus Omnitrophica bacterium CG11_big_fil_rev_8_21_14_0_20_45_26]|uniref:TRASH domain-containing protein n=1 Tax=Candidatus Abzuiibacterium crystallinum TaxID=1974748 RepID=A0A2H0LN54_9BACT|nr:MAG: hypothetical protein COV74_07200 [Candidatus Omnitrophica bacterium CG11_big_fil_rev_8_21_14_0_20_45_26]PIW65489.1 MAG: hypothetical protein COW12_01460 [Candidatus Omnitrophica bacterium CG12_big_fil_rev_8_21_14_0_65_45_16]